MRSILTPLHVCKSLWPTKPPPKRTKGVSLYYGGWTMETLQKSPAGEKFLEVHYPFSYDYYHFWTPQAGYYDLQVRFRKSSRKNWKEVSDLETGEWEPSETVILVTYLLTELAHGRNVLRNSICRTASNDGDEDSYPTLNAGVHMNKGKLVISKVMRTEKAENLYLAVGKKCNRAT